MRGEVNHGALPTSMSGEFSSNVIIDQAFVSEILSENEQLKKRNAVLEGINDDLLTEIAALETENEDLLKLKHAWTDSIVSFIRLFKFQSAALGHTFFLLLPLCGAVVSLSSVELTDWSSAVPRYNAQVFWRVWGTFTAGGWVLWWVGIYATKDASFSPSQIGGGFLIATLITFPVMSFVCASFLLLFIGVPLMTDIDVHFSYFDIVAFITMILGTIVFGHPLSSFLGAQAQQIRERSSSVAGEPSLEAEQTKRVDFARRALRQLLRAIIPLCVCIACTLRTCGDLCPISRVRAALLRPDRTQPTLTLLVLFDRQTR